MNPSSAPRLTTGFTTPNVRSFSLNHHPKKLFPAAGRSAFGGMLAGACRNPNWSRMTFTIGAIGTGLAIPTLLLRVRVSESARGAFFLHVNYWAQSAYRPEREIGTMVVFHGAGLYSDDPTLGWDELVDHVVAQELPGPHRRNRDAMHEPFVEHLAAALEPHLLGVPARAAVE